MYSESVDGRFCLPCVLFSVPENQGQLETRPFKRWNKLFFVGEHEKKKYHQNSLVAAEDFRKTMTTTPAIDQQLYNQRLQRIKANNEMLHSITEALQFMGKLGPPLRGHRDNIKANPTLNKGKLIEPLNFRANSDDKLLAYMETCKKNARYSSKTILTYWH